LFNVLLTGKNSSEGLRTTWYIQLMASDNVAANTRQTMICAVRGARSNARHQRRRRARLGQKRDNRKRPRLRRVRGPCPLRLAMAA
jgi:hypothetical protein